MAAALTITPASGAVTAKHSVCRIDVTGASPNNDDGTELRLYILADAPEGVDDGRSEVFAVSADGKHSWLNYIFPEAGSWTLRLKKVSDDSDVATLAVTVA
jgi:hypothetical protein